MCIQIPPIEKDIDLWLGDSKELLGHLETNSVDSVVTDPPYGLSFMGKDWDKALPPIEIWEECFRVLKPGGYIVAMSASRTWHRLAVQLEDVGFIVHPMIGWLYGSGFPKATDLSKQFDKQAGTVKTELDSVLAKRIGACKGGSSKNIHQLNATPKDKIGHRIIPQSDLAKKWAGWKYGLQSLKPALEPIFVGQKPHLRPMIKNVEKYGVGAMNIDACRVEVTKQDADKTRRNAKDTYSNFKDNTAFKLGGSPNIDAGRHPSNLLHDGSESVEAEFLKQGGISKTGDIKPHENRKNNGEQFNFSKEITGSHKGDTGTASRFFNSLPITQDDFISFKYCAKASKKERGYNNKHPTVKPLALMTWLVKLVTPVGGQVVDPFAGSGSTGVAAKKNGFKFLGIEMNEEYYEIAKERIERN